MGYLSVEVVRKSCAFVLQIQEPIDTLKKLAMFFQDRHIQVDSLQMHRFNSNEAMLIVHCQIEKDRITAIVELMEQWPGITELESMEGK